MSHDQTADDRTTTTRDRIVESAQRAGVQLDPQELDRWMDAVTTTSEGDEIVMDSTSGVFGHRVSMLDFSPADLARFRAIGRIVEFDDVPGVIETALALSGSAAQSKMQTYPGDCDYFERVNIIAPSRAGACSMLAGLIRDKARNFTTGPGYQLIEVKFGSFPQAVRRGEADYAKGSPIAWMPPEIEAGQIEATTPAGAPVTISWDDVAHEPGWCKLDWLVADAERGQLANASNMIDATWEAPDGAITPLDGYLDGYFQEIYLDAQSAPIFDKLVKQVSSNALDDYIAQLEREVRKYFSPDHPNYGKAAKRMYNVFRLSGRYEEAAFLRELFDEPAALLYQVYALIRTVEEAAVKSEVFSMDNILDQTDELIMSVVKVLEGPEELEIVRHLLRLHRGLSRHTEGTPLGPQVDAAQAEVLNIVNNFFYEKMTSLPQIQTYVAGLAT